MASIPVIPGVKVVTKGVLNKPLKNIICAILFGGLNNLLKGNILCIDANLEKLAGVSVTQGLKDAIKELRGELAALQKHVGITDTLGRINEAIADIQKVLALGGMCPVPLKAPRIPNVLNDVANSFFGGANSLLNQLGRLAKPQICIDARGGINTGTYNPDSILGQMNRTVKRLGNIPADSADKFERSLRGVSRAIRSQIDRELFPDFRHKHNLLTGSPVVAGVPAITVMDVKDAVAQAQTLVSAINSTGSFPAQCVEPGRGAEANITFGSDGEITSIGLAGMSRHNVTHDSTTGSGIGAVFNVAGKLDQTYSVEFVEGGMGYAVDEVLTISSATLSGNDLQIKVSAVNDSGQITAYNVISGIVSSTGYDGYNSGIIKFVDKDTLEEITNNVVTEQFEGTVQLDANGSITGVNITNPGKGYQPGTQVNITGAIGRATATPVIENFKVTGITLNQPGTGYRIEDTEVKFINPNTGLEIELAPAQIEPIFDSTDTILTGINIVAGGLGYPSNASLRIRNTRIQALATAVVEAGELVSVTVTKNGKGYVPGLAQIKFVDPATGLQITPLEFPVVNPTIDDVGNLTGITVVDPGSGLPSSVLVEVLFNNPVTNATASVQINSQGAVTGAALVSPGSGFRSDTTVIELVNPLNQPIKREKAEYTPIIDGQGNLTGFNMVAEGIGYQPGTLVEITDNFSSASLTAQIDAEGQVTGFNIVQAGAGYRNPGINLATSPGSAYVFKAAATALFENGILSSIELLEPGKGYDPAKTKAIIIDESAQSCPDGVESQNIWLNVLGPEVYSLAVEALTPQDPTFVRQEPVYDYCGRLIGYQEMVVAGDRAAEGGNPLDGAVTEPLDLNHEFVWINAPAEERVGWGVTGQESEQLVGAPGAKRLTMALNLNPEITLYRGQSHIFSIPSGLTKEFYIYETIEDPNGREVVLADGTTVRLKPNIAKKFSQGLHRFETGEYLEDANGRDEDTEIWSGTDLQGNPIPEPESRPFKIELKNGVEVIVKDINGAEVTFIPWLRRYLFPEGTNLLFQIGEADPTTLQKHWPDFLAYSDALGQNFGIFRVI